MKIKITVTQDEGLDSGLVINSQSFHVSRDPVAECERCRTVHKGPAAEKMLDTRDGVCPNCGSKCFVPWVKPVCLTEDSVHGVGGAFDPDEFEAEVVRHVKAAVGIA